jgi:hypothetical protein
MSDIPPDRSLETAVEEFSAVERSLREFLERGETLRSTGEALQRNAATLEAAERSLAEGTSTLYDVGGELKDIARDMRDAVRVIRSFDPQAAERLDALSAQTAQEGSAREAEHSTTVAEFAAMRIAHNRLLLLAGAGVVIGVVNIFVR